MIKQLIQDLVYDRITLNQALTRAKLISFKIKDENFKNWINDELNGYVNKDSQLPSYRRITCSVKGKVADYFGNISHIPILVDELDRRVNGNLYHINITQSISTLESSIKNAEGSFGQAKLHPELVNMIYKMSDCAQDGYSLLEAAQEIQYSQLQHIIDLSKQKLIDTLLELNEAFPNLENEFAVTKENIDQVRNIITNNIYGSYNPLNLGIGKNLKQKNKQNIQSKYNFNELDQLKAFGVDEQSIGDLKEILKDKSNPEKEKSVAKRITAWLGSLTTKAVEKGVELQIPLIMEKISNYL